MAYSSKIDKLAQTFYQKAVTAQQNQSAEYATTIIDQMKGLVNGGITATKHLLDTGKYNASAGLSALKDKLPELMNRLNSYSHDSDNGSFHETMKTMLGGLSFYTSRGNVGTGYDPATAVSDGGYTAPEYYVRALQELNEKLKRVSPPNPSRTPMGKDPIAVSLIRQQNESKKKV